VELAAEAGIGDGGDNPGHCHAEDISDRYVGRMLRLAYLAPTVLDRLLISRIPPAVSIKDLSMAAELPWAEQEAAVIG
jgi:hypothetical protein